MRRAGKMGLVAVLVAALAMPSPALAATAAATSPVKYKAGIGYDFEKISHPTVGTSQPDGIVDYQGGGAVAVPGEEGNVANNAGDRGQSYSWSAVSSGDWLYVGTCYAALSSSLTLMQSMLGDKYDADVMRATPDAMFNGTFYNGQEDGADSDGILVRVNTKTGETQLLMSNSKNNVSPMFRNAVAYNGKLYFCGIVSANGGPGLPSVYQVDPALDPEDPDFFKMVYQGLSSLIDYGQAARQGISTGIRGMCVYDGQLVISNVGKGSDGRFVATILTSSDPSQGFTQIASSEDLFNYPALRYQDSTIGGAIWDMTEYDGHLYVSICSGTTDNAPDENSMQSFALVRGDKSPDGSWTWTAVAGDTENDGARYTFGIDPERTRAGAAGLVAYDGYLYVGEFNDEVIALERIIFDKSAEGAGAMGGVDCSFMNANLEQSVNLYRMHLDEDDEEQFELVVGDATEMFPEGSLSGLGSGFGHNENQYIWRMQVFDGKLYLGTFDTSSLLEPIGQFSNGDLLAMTPEQWKSQVEKIRELLRLLLRRPVVDDVRAADVDEGAEVAAGQVAADDEAVVLDEPAAEEQAVVLDEPVVVEADEESQVLKDFEGLNDALDGATDLLGGQVATLSNDADTDAAYKAKVEAETQYFQAFADVYEAALDEYEALVAEYEQAYGTSLPDEIKDAYNSLLNGNVLKRLRSVITCMGYLKDANRGFDMYVTSDGEHFAELTTSGFNDPYNNGLRVFAVTNQGLCLGTANPFFGTQLWIQRKEVTPDPVEPVEPGEEPTEPTEPTTPPSESPEAPKPADDKPAAKPKKAKPVPNTGDATSGLPVAVGVAGGVALIAGAVALRRMRKSQ